MTKDLSDLLLSPSWRAGKAYTPNDEARLRGEIARKLEGNTLEIALAAFPFKVPNPLKTQGIGPDWGERMALERLARLSSEAQELGYELRWRIITDGAYYAQELSVAARDVKDYQDGVRDLAAVLGVPARFIELDSLVAKKPFAAKALDFASDEHRPYVLRAGGMMNTHAYTDRLSGHFAAENQVNAAIARLLSENEQARTQAERAAGLYQALKLEAEIEQVFARFPEAVRASIQPDASRALHGRSVERPLSIRIVESKGQNLFPWLGVPCKNGVIVVHYRAEALAQGFSPAIRDSLVVYCKP